MNNYYAQPYSCEIDGFYFETIEEYRQKAGDNEYEIQWIDGNELDRQLFKLFGASHSPFNYFEYLAEDYSDDYKLRTILSENTEDTPSQIDITIYEFDTIWPEDAFKQYAEQLIEDGCFGEIPEHLANYIDVDKIAHDLMIEGCHDYNVIDGITYIFQLS